MEKIVMVERKYPSRRRELLKFLQDENGNVGQGLDDQILANCVLMIVDYFNYHLPNVKIPAKAIPDVDKFRPKGLQEYTVEQFIYNRLYVNLKTFIIADRPPEGVRPDAIGGYTSSTKILRLYKENFEKHVREKCQSIDGGNVETVMQAVIVHELIHALSRTKGQGTGLVYFDNLSVKHNVSLNEGITERLAMDICELSDVFLTAKKEDFQVTANTTSSYKLEVGIANLLRVADGERFYLKFLVDASRISIKRENKDLMSVAKRVADIHRPTKDEDIPRAKVNDYQLLQYVLIKDILENKLQKELLDPVRRGAPFDSKKFRSLRKEMYEIGKCLVPTIKNINANEELDFTLGFDYIKKMMDSGKIARTPNVEMFVNLMVSMKEVERKFGIPPKR